MGRCVEAGVSVVKKSTAPTTTLRRVVSADGTVLRSRAMSMQGKRSSGGSPLDADEADAAAEIKKLISAADLAHKLGLRVNAGHGLNYQNTPGILAVPHLETLNTGHSIIARAVFST